MAQRLMRHETRSSEGVHLSAVVWVVAMAARAAVAAMPNAGQDPPNWEGRRGNSVSLNGTWEFSPGDGSERAECPDGANRLAWKAVTLPGPFMPWSQEAANQAKVVWARRSFKVTPSQAEALAVLRWNRIACGAAAFINGQKVGENEPTGPFQVIVPAGVLRPGDNRIVLKIRGAAGVPRSRSGNALIPAGFGVGLPEVTDDVWMDFADTAYMKWVLALPDLARSRVKIRVTPTGLGRLDDLKAVAQVKCWPDGMVLGEGQASAGLTPSQDPFGGKHFFVDVPMPGFQAWTYEEPHLYTAEVSLRCEEKVLDTATIRFGMREITIADGHYLLNGKTLRLRGSELVFEWNWGDIIADTLTRTPIAWKLPEREGSYWLTARTTGIRGRPVLSQRFVRAVRPPEVPAALLARRFVVLGGDAAADAWFASRGLQVDQGLDGLVPGRQVIVIWDAAHLTMGERQRAQVLREFAAAGGRVVVLATRSWDWTDLCDIKTGDTRGSRVFPYLDSKHTMLAAVQPEWLMRWNGLPGTVAAGSLDGPALATAEKVLWVRELKTCVAAEVPVAGGMGTLLFSQLDVQRRVDRSKPGYDPVAERILIAMLQKTP